MMPGSHPISPGTQRPALGAEAEALVSCNRKPACTCSLGITSAANHLGLPAAPHGIFMGSHVQCNELARGPNYP